ncbi:hypothetical protein HAZT_HAZT004925 [Hyalella azteca]|uniref:Caprin-1 dimerization domain-containing protein n=1 Tax=Hyalella azteca TaxID=294128 RepID=A0A6A0GSY2_HYAAZ|nr:hypothetical protein HAZT_HAZT004925 [Hyalella azteca]
MSKDTIQYKKITPDQLNHLREMDAVYSALDAVKEISQVVNESCLQLAVTHPELFSEPPSEEHPCASEELIEKLQRIHALITPPPVTESTKSIGDVVHSSAQHIHLLVDGRNKFVTKGTTYEDIKTNFIDSASVCSYYVEKPVEPEPEEQSEPEQPAADQECDKEISEPEAAVGQTVEEEATSGDAAQLLNHSGDMIAPVASFNKIDDLTMAAAGAVPVDASTTAFLIRDAQPPPPPGLQPHPQQQQSAPLLMNEALQLPNITSQEAFVAAFTQQQQQHQQHLQVMFQMDHEQQQKNIAHQQKLEQQQRQQHQQLQQQQLQQQHLHQQELNQREELEDADDCNSLHNDSIKDLLTLGSFDFLQESVIDKPSGGTSSTVSEVAVYMDPAVVSIGSVNPAEMTVTADPHVAPVEHYTTPPAQHSVTQSSVSAQNLPHSINNLAAIPTPNFPPTVPPPATSLSNVPPPPIHSSNSRQPPAPHQLEAEQFFSHAPPPSHSSTYAPDALAYSVPPPSAAAPPQAALTPTLDNTPNPPPPIPLPQEHTSSSWDQPSQSWSDDQPQMNGGVQTCTSPGAENQSSSTDWSAAPIEDKNRRNRSWGSEEGDGNMGGNWSDVRSPPRPAMQPQQQDEYDRKMGGGSGYRNGPPNRMRRDNEVDDYGSGHDEGSYWGGEEDYDDRRGSMYSRGRGGRGRMNTNHNNGGYRGRGGFSSNGYQNSNRGGYGGPQSFRNRGGMGGPSSGGFRGMRGANRGGMPRGSGAGGGAGASAGGAYRNSRSNYSSVQRPYYGQ